MSDYQKQLAQFARERRRIVHLRKVKKLTHREIGELLGVSKQSVAKRLRKEGVE